jgi:hypothetical protein
MRLGILSFPLMRLVNRLEVTLDNSFLRYKKELPAYGFEVQKILLKNKVVKFHQL